jgi:acylphosphatase
MHAMPGAADIVARRVVIHGHVQGVWFRGTARHEATERGVAGWARNRSDGTVEAWFEGDPADVEELVAWCHRGPRNARVERVDVTDAGVAGVAGFEIR